MRSPNIALLLISATAAAVSLVACSGDVVTANSGGSGTTNGTAGTTIITGSTGSTGSTIVTGSTGSTSSGTVTPPCVADCCLDPNSCKAADLTCVGLVDNAGNPKPGLRLAELITSAPPALAQGLVAGVVSSAVALADPNCNLAGSGTFSWLLQFDLPSNVLRTGGGKPVADPTFGYGFVNQTVGGIVVAPVDLDAPVGPDGSFSTANATDLVLPIYLDASASQVVLLPLRNLQMAGVLSPSHDCIGHYNAEGLQIDNLCLPDDMHPTFVPDGKISALIRLEDADTIPIPSLQETLCVLLANNMGVPGPNGKVCERDANNVIVFKGDACSNGVGCGDSVTFAASFAASSVKIN